MCLITFMICLQLRDKHGTVQFKNRHSDMQSIYFIAYEPGGGGGGGGQECQFRKIKLT